jgi:hypothetical protein
MEYLCAQRTLQLPQLSHQPPQDLLPLALFGLLFCREVHDIGGLLLFRFSWLAKRDGIELSYQPLRDLLPRVPFGQIVCRGLHDIGGLLLIKVSSLSKRDYRLQTSAAPSWIGWEALRCRVSFKFMVAG